MTPTKIYLAARYSRRLELCGARDVLTALGYEITSRWLNGSHQIDNQGVPIGEDGERRFEMGDPALSHWREHFATEDVADVLAAEILVAFTEEPRSGNSRGGRHVELGIALGAGKRIVIAGPRENVFTWLPVVEWYPDWAHLVMAWSPYGLAPCVGCGQLREAHILADAQEMRCPDGRLTPFMPAAVSQ